MYPDQPPAHTPGNPYDFILNPQNPQKRGLFSNRGGDSFITKIVFIVGGAVVLMTITALVINLFFDSKTNLDKIVSITQSEQEIIRLGTSGDDASSQSIKNAAANTLLTIITHQKEWLAFLDKQNRSVAPEELSLKKNAATDKKLKEAKQASAFDAAYGDVMRAELDAYAASLKDAYQGASDKQEKAVLTKHYGQVQLLLKQWPN